MGRAVEWMERWQIPLYLAAIGGAAVVGLAVPAIAEPLTFAINPAGVLEVGFAGLGADHKVFIASVTGKGARENGSVFQRYSRTTFQVDADQEAA